MQVLLSLKDSSIIWQLASKKEARENALRENREIRPGSPIASCIPKVSDILGRGSRVFPSFAPSFSLKDLQELSEKLGLMHCASADVFETRQRHTGTSRANSVVASGLRALQFFELFDGVFLYPPEACFYYAMQSLPFAQALLLGYELCGSFTLDPAIQGGVGRRCALTTPRAIENMANNLHGARGVCSLRKCIPWIIKGSESPRESILAICLVLPRRFGGYGLPKPELNREITLDSQARKVYGRKKCRLDLYYSEIYLALEYDSDAEHASPAARRKDSRREAALALQGIEVLPVTSVQLASVAQMDGIAQIVASRLGLSLETAVRDYPAKKATLLESLTGRRDWLIV